MMLRVERLAMVAGVVAAFGCGSDKQDCSMVSDEGLDRGQLLVSVSDAQRRQICDFDACSVGGYGARQSCSGGEPVTIARNQGACLASWPANPACTATVEDFFGCMEAVAASPCVSTLFSDPACSAATEIACLTFTSNLTSAAMLAGPRQ
jgi:hypothetical protein